MMNEGPSFSFLSQNSQKYPTLSFNSLERLDSNKNLDSLIYNLPGSKPDMKDKVQIVLLLQAAEIERLSLTLEAYKTYLEQNINASKEISRGEPSVQLLSNGEIEQKSTKFNESFPSPDALRQGSQGSLSDVNKYLQKLQNKYKRALKYIQSHAAARTQLENTLQDTKEELAKTQANFQAFKRSSVREYQFLREELDSAKRAELSFQLKEVNSQKQGLREIISSRQAQLRSQQEKHESDLKREKESLAVALREAERLTSQNQEYRRAIQRAELKHRETLNQKQNSLTLVGLEMERLNSVNREKTARFKENETMLTERITACRQEINLLQREVERGKQKIAQMEEEMSRKGEEIVRLEKYSSSLNARISEMGTVNEEKTSDIRMKESRLTQELKSLNEVLSRSEDNFNRQIQHYKVVNARLTSELTKTEQMLSNTQQTIKNNENSFSHRVQEMSSQIETLNKEARAANQREKKAKDELKMGFGKWEFQRQILERKLQQLALERRRELQMSRTEQSGIVEKFKRSYEEKIRQMEIRIGEYEERLRHQHQIQLQLSTQNDSLKTALDQSQKSKSSIMRNRSFEQLFQEIETLCSSVRQKESFIESLKQEISSLNESSRKNLHETLNLREMLIKLLSLLQLLEHTRKEDQKTLASEMRKLFQTNSHLLSQVWESQQAVTKSLRGQKAEIDQYQSQLMRTKDFEISNLRGRVQHLQHQSMDQQSMEQLVSKAIALTKENSELKSALSASHSQLKHLKDNQTRLTSETEQQANRFRVQLQEKEEDMSRLRTINEHISTVLLQNQQKLIQLESSKTELGSLQKNVQQELAIRDGLIADLKASLQFKSQQSSKTSNAMEQQIFRSSQLNNQINELKQSYNHQISAKTEQLEVSRAETEGLRRQIKGLNTSLQQKQNTIRLLKDSIRTLQLEVAKGEEEKYHPQQTIRETSCPRCVFSEQSAREWEEERRAMRTEMQILRAENRAFQEEQGSRGGYSEKIPVLNAELSRLEGLIEELRLKNSQSILTNHELSIRVEQQRHNRQKIATLNQEVERLQGHNVDLLEQVNAYRLELCQEAYQEKNAQEMCAILVLLSAEVEALREGSSLKEKELVRLRKAHLGS